MKASAENIARALHGRRNGRGWIACCPVHRDKKPSLSLRDAEVGVLLFCHAGCDRLDVIDELIRLKLWDDYDPMHAARVAANDQAKSDFAPSSRTFDEERSAYARSIWKQACDIRGTLAQTYLERRGLELDDDAAVVLRFHPRCPFGENTHVPALVAAFHPFEVPRDRAPVAIHRIGLTPSGDKIEKKMLGPVGGCAVKLDECEGTGLAIAEGIETGLAARARFKPLWALGNAGAVRVFVPIPGIEHLTIFADHDTAGIQAATACGERWTQAGCDVVMRKPKTPGTDYADGR